MGECRALDRRVNIKLTEQIRNVNFNPCSARPSNARFVFFCLFLVADAARRHGLRIACGCVPRRKRSLRRSSSRQKVSLGSAVRL